MPRYFSIGQFSKITGLTPRALRLYAREGLLRPDLVNPETGYRYYGQTQARAAERIRLLRSIDLPLEDIRALLAQDAPEDLLERHKTRIEAQLGRFYEALQALESLNARDLGTYSVALKDVPAQPVVYLRRRTPLEQIETTRAGAFGELYGFLAQQGLTPTGRGFSANARAGHFEPHEALDWRTDWLIDLCVPVAETIDNDRLGSRVFPAGRVAYIVHTGPYEPLFQVYKKIAGWLGERGLKHTGQTREIYHLGLGEEPRRNDLETEVQFYLA